jgi:hypothetical protein
VRIFARAAEADRVRSVVSQAFTIADEPPMPQPLIVERLDSHTIDEEKPRYLSPAHDAVPAPHAAAVADRKQIRAP